MAAGTIGNTVFGPEPPKDCPRCPRLVAYRQENARLEPHWFNGAVPSFGTAQARLLIVGLAPGRMGANRTGRPFTGDYAGVLLYETLIRYGFAKGEYHARPDDGLKLVDCMISNAVRCAPPENKPEPKEIATCRPFFEARLASLNKLKIILALGRIAHDQTLAALGEKKTLYPFAHGARHVLSGGRILYDSFHCSRYNTSTRRLTPEMFQSVFEAIRRELA
ncbi:uracil-DNA glycosylase [Hyphomicrobium sp. 99]|uniref:uracil-DNA glycosylase n=1 Tax=Hyphomicrobium sp. 99 TaxID=1163419 RepID=UPI0005F8350A|nr:uracil-DNA glycosylase [Hyphomicrobium sp. 99]